MSQQLNFERPASASNDDESYGAGAGRMMQDESNHSSSLLDADGDSSGSTSNSKHPSVPSQRELPTNSNASEPPPALPLPSTTLTTTTPAGPVLMLVSADKYDYRLQGGWQKQDYRPLNERYRNWRKNTYFMYDFFTANVTVHPSRTVEWLPDIKKERLNVPLQTEEPFRNTRAVNKSAAVDRRKSSLEVEFYCQKAIVGTLDGLEGLRGGLNASTSGSSIQHAIFVLDVRIPIDDGENFDINPPAQFGLNEWGAHAITRIETTRFVPVGNREVFRVRHMPQLSDLVAVRTRDESFIGIYDLQDSFLFESYPLDNAQANPALALSGFAVGSCGYGLQWHPNLSGYVIAASYEPKIAIWNIEQNSRTSSGSGGSTSNASIKSRRGAAASSAIPTTTIEILPLRTYEYHTKAVQEVAWHPDPSCRSMFVSVGDDGMLGVCDIRESPSAPDFKPALFTKAHDYPINSVAWSPASRDCSTLLATGAMDGTIGLWDLRRPDLRLHTIAGAHTADIVQIAFNPHDPLVLASTALDNRLLIFDLGCIGAEKLVNLPQHDPWPSELAFAHDGQSAPVNEFSWNPYYKRMLLSVADDNMCQCTEISQQAWNAWHKRRHYGPLALNATPPVDRVTNKTALDADEILPQEEPPTSVVAVAGAAAGGITTSELSRRQQFKLHSAPEFRFPPGVRVDNNNAMNGL